MKLSIENLSFSFRKKPELFSELSLETSPGTIYGLFGLNGAGKTTLLKLISGLLFPKEGSCSLNGTDTSTRMPSVSGRIFFLPEQFDLPSLTGNQYLSVYVPFYPEFNRDFFDEMAAGFGLDTGENLTRLSHGQQKKFMIAFGIATSSPLLLLDEPTNGLDIPSKSTFRKIIAGMDLENRTIIISTHQVRDLGRCIDHLLVLHEGRMSFNASYEDIIQNFHFKKTETNEGGDIIYSEEVLGGYKSVVAGNDPDFTSELDIELLFNAVITRPELINQKLKGTAV